MAAPTLNARATLSLETAFAIYWRDHGRHVTVPHRIIAAQRHLFGLLGKHRACADISPGVIRDYISKRMAKGRKSATIRRELQTLKAALRHCWDVG